MLVASAAIPIIYSTILDLPHRRTAVEAKSITGIKITCMSLFLVLWIYYDQILLRRIKSRKTHSRILKFSTLFQYLTFAGIAFMLLLFALDVTERMHFSPLGYTDNFQIVCNACWPFFLIGAYLFHLKARLKSTRSMLEIKRIAAGQAFINQEYDLMIEHTKEILEIEPQHSQAIATWGIALMHKARKHSVPERDTWYQKANEKFAQAHTLDPDDLRIMYTWGLILAEQANHQKGGDADALFAQAYEKFEKALVLKRERNNSQVYSYLGWALICQAMKKKAEERRHLLEAACDKYEKSFELKGDTDRACDLINWTWALGERSRYEQIDKKMELLNSAEKKVRQALAINPRYNYALSNYGIVLMRKAVLEGNQARTKLLRQAKRKLEKAERIKKGVSTYYLACVCALKGEEEECRRWLTAAQGTQSMPSKEQAMEDEDLASVRDREWFQEIQWDEPEDENRR